MVFTRPRVASDDNFLAKVIKYIPAEIIAGYVAISGILDTVKSTVPFHTVQWVIAGILLILTPLWILRLGRVAGQPLPIYQAIVGAVAFVCWVFALSGGPFSTLSWYSPAYGAIVLVLFTLIAPLGEGLIG